MTGRTYGVQKKPTSVIPKSAVFEYLSYREVTLEKGCLNKK